MALSWAVTNAEHRLALGRDPRQDSPPLLGDLRWRAAEPDRPTP